MAIVIVSVLVLVDRVRLGLGRWDRRCLLVVIVEVRG